eukprot:SAG11_NODE_1866_length_4152_cov_15.643967_2_plen_146_part_00
MWTLGRGSFPFLTMFLIGPAVCLVVNFQMKIIGWVLLAEVAKDSISLLWGVFMTWWYRGVWYLVRHRTLSTLLLGPCRLTPALTARALAFLNGVAERADGQKALDAGLRLPCASTTTTRPSALPHMHGFGAAAAGSTDGLRRDQY